MGSYESKDNCKRCMNKGVVNDTTFKFKFKGEKNSQYRYNLMVCPECKNNRK